MKKKIENNQFILEKYIKVDIQQKWYSLIGNISNLEQLFYIFFIDRYLCWYEIFTLMVECVMCLELEQHSWDLQPKYQN